jgi:periplasmic divalent cation tolerance protein
MHHKLVYVTAADHDAALALARALLEARLIACANVIDKATSLYWWEGEIREEREAILVAKTTERLVPAVVEKVVALHDYDCPCVVALPIEQGNPAFLAWVSAETAPSK